MEKEQHEITAPYADRLMPPDGGQDTLAVDETTKEVIHTIFEELQSLEICGHDEMRKFWFTVPRGTIEDFGDYDEYLECEEVSNHKEFEELWLYHYPKPVKWYEFTAVHWNGWYSILVNRELVLQIQGEERKKEYPEDRSRLAKWLLSVVNEVIASVRNGTYNDPVRANLPYERRRGKILRKDYWQIFPEEKEWHLKEISQQEIDRFVLQMESQSDDSPKGRLKEMTAGKFFDCCRLGYEANNYKGTDELSAKELYQKHGYDFNSDLLDLNPDSAKEFCDMVKSRQYNGHPWRVCSGGSSTSISIYPANDEKGWYLSLSGSCRGRSVETIKFYLALTDAGIPVYLNDGKELANMITGRDHIGIVPEGIFPRYCSSWFPKEPIIDYMNLRRERAEEIIAATYWYPLGEVRMIQDEDIKRCAE
ncbi:MAG: hypothetical protein FWD37_00805 [Methanomassiliicoccaceae archaeon]|nr:hypothetical protein [Methanomassiliicoccaceae archaeon]